MKLRIYMISLLLIGFSLVSEAKIFRNAYISFELPEGWNCNLEATEWVCRSPDPKMTKEAVIVFTAKEMGPTDNTTIYEQTISTARTVMDKTGRAIPSNVVAKATQTKINDHTWIDGMQKGSEIPNYFTRYLATVKERVAILITFSAHADYFARYSSDFFRAVKSLTVITSNNLLAKPSSGSPGSANQAGVWGAASSAPGGLSMAGEQPFGQKRKTNSNNLNVILMSLGALLVGAGAFFFLKGRR